MSDVSNNSQTGRRKFLTAAAGTVLLGSFAGCSDNQGESDGTDTSTDEETEAGTDTEASTQTATATATPQPAVVEVGPNAENVFKPGTDEPLTISPGTTVTFVWKSSGHSIVVDSQPDGANWQGHDSTESSGYELTHTFEETGTYEYHCGPHGSFGMEGTIIVE